LGLAAQVKGAMDMLGFELTAKEVREMVMEYDSDGSGQIELDEFMMVRCPSLLSCSECNVLQRSVQTLLSAPCTCFHRSKPAPEPPPPGRTRLGAALVHACTTRGMKGTGDGGGSRGRWAWERAMMSDDGDVHGL